MVEDIRLAIGFLDHHKIIKLKRRLGSDAVLCLISLFTFAAKYRPKGELHDMNAEDIAIAAKWDGDEDILISTLIELRILDQMDGYLSLHGWAERNPWAFGAPERVEKAKLAGQASSAKKAQLISKPIDSVQLKEESSSTKTVIEFNSNTDLVELKTESSSTPYLTLPYLSLPNHNQTQQHQSAGEGDRRRDASPDPIGEVAVVYQNNIGALTALTAEKLAGLTDEYSGAWVLEAITVAVEANARKLSYIEGVLKNWHVNGFKSAPPNGKSRDRPPKPEIDNSWMDAYEQAMKPAGEVSA